MPGFRFKGKPEVESVPGGMLSFCIILVTLLYAAVKFEKLMMRSNPNVSSFLERGMISTRQKLNIRDAGLQFAIGVEGYLDK